MDQIKGKGLKFVALILAIVLTIGITPHNATKAGGEENYNSPSVTEDVGVLQNMAAQPDTTSAATLAVTQVQSLALDAEGYGSNGKFMAPIDVPDPNAIKIYTVQDLDNVRNNLTGSYVLMNDIDLAGFNEGEWVPIGDNSTGSYASQFTGSFDGQGHKISNLKITGSGFTYIGLFGYVGGAIIKNLGLDNTYIDVTYLGAGSLYAGGISGYNGNSGYSGGFINCYNTGSITASYSGRVYAGGICGYMYFTGIYETGNCYNTGAVTAISSSSTSANVSYAGGIFGYGYSNGNVGDYYYNTGDITASSAYTGNGNNSFAGGIYGFCRGIVGFTTISNCHNTGNVRSNGSAGGIFVGTSCSAIACYNTGTVTASSSVSTYLSQAGGICGSGGVEGGGNNRFTDCYNEGDVLSSSMLSSAYAGGISLDGLYSNCYNTGNVTATSNSTQSGALAGGIATRMPSQSFAADCFNAGDVTASSRSGSTYAGGISASLDSGNITRCYNAGNVISHNTATSANYYTYAPYTGGIIGNGNIAGNITQCVVLSGEIMADSILSSLNIYSNLIGIHSSLSNNLALVGIPGNAVDDTGNGSGGAFITLEQAKQQSTYENLGWDFANVWEMVAGHDFPQLQVFNSGNIDPTSTVSDPPREVTAFAGSRQASISFIAPTYDGGSPITGYKVISSPDGITATGMDSPITVTGLTNGTTYTFTVIATNAVGDSIPSAPTNAVTPTSRIINEPPVFIEVGETKDINKFGSDGNNQFRWTSSNPYVVSANAGQVTGITVGSAIVTYTAPDETAHNFNVEVVAPARTDSGTVTAKFTVNKDIAGREGKTARVEAAWDNSWFAKSSTVYNHDMAILSAAMSAAAYLPGEEYQNEVTDKAYVFDALNQMHFYDIKTSNYDADYWKNDKPGSVGYTLANKKITVTGEVYNLIAVIIRGTVYTEWYDDFNILSSPTSGNKVHAGFLNAATEVRIALEEYISSLHLTDKNKIWITGHSRGAGVANILAKTLTDNGVLAMKKDIYAYTFATPNITREGNKENSELEKALHGNIFNIVNVDDFVPHILLAKWGYSRYGVTYGLPSANTTLTSLAMKLHFCELTGSEYQPYHDGPIEMKNLVKYVYDLAQSPEHAYITPLFHAPFVPFCTLVDYFEDLADVLVSPNAWTIPNMLTYSHGQFTSLNNFFFWNGNFINPLLNFNHAPETYISWLQSINKAGLVSFQPYLEISINCPVDVYVYDEQNSLVGKCVNDVVDETIADNVLIVVENGHKSVYLQNDQKYSIKMVGTDKGTLNYSISQMDLVGGVTKRFNFNNINLANGIIIWGDVNVFIGAEDVDFYQLNVTDSNGAIVRTLTPDEVLQGSELEDISITVTSGNGGFANGNQLLTKGDVASVSATAFEGYRFAGWYENNVKIVDAGEGYSFIATTERVLQARFTVNNSEVGNDGGLNNNGLSGGGYVANYPANNIGDMMSDSLPDPSVPAVTALSIVFSGDSSYSYIFGYPDGTVRPENNITRAEAAQIFFTLINDNNKALYGQVANNFSDTGTDQWYSEAIGYLYAAGIITGYEDGSFRPNTEITRAEFATMTAKFVEIDASGTLPFTDTSEGHWAYQYIATAYNNGWIVGYPDGTFKPDSKIKRVEVITIVNKMIGRLPTTLGTDSPFSDLSPVSWYYGQVLAAVGK